MFGRSGVSLEEVFKGSEGLEDVDGAAEDGRGDERRSE